MKAVPPSSRTIPWLTLCLVALMVFAAAVPLELAIYDRERAHEWWRFGTSWLIHYDLVHLAGNGAAVAALGLCVERETSAQFMLWLLFALVVLCSVLLHVALPHYSLYAGISPLSYGLLGCMVVLAWQHRPVAGLGILVAATVVQFQSWAAGGVVGPVSVRPVWELHGLAFVAGVLATICWRARRLQDMASVTPEQVLTMSPE